MNNFHRFLALAAFVLAFLMPKKALVGQCAPAFGEDCESACFWPGSSFSNFQLTTLGSTGSTVPIYCGSIENDLWFIVTPTATNHMLTVYPSSGTCTNGNGVQIALYEICGGPFLQCNVGCEGCGTMGQSITVNGLVPGAPYLLLIDGWAGDQCDFVVAAVPPLGEALSDSIFFIQGHVRVDLDKDCAMDSTDVPAKFWPVKLDDGSPTERTTFTNADGFYRFFSTSPGSFEVTTSEPLYPFSAFTFCQNDVLASVSNQNPVDTVDFLAGQDSSCSYVAGQIMLPLLRPCQKTSIWVNFLNYGLAESENAAAVLRLDPIFQIDSIVPPPASTSGDTLFFDLGDLGPMAGGSIRIYGALVCDTSIVGNALCAELWLPGKICDTVGTAFSSALLRPRAECLGNGTARFVVKNVGKAPTPTPNEYIIIEDEVVMKSGTIPAGFQPGEEMEIIAAADGASLLFEISQNQQPLAAAAFESVFLKNCGGQTEQFLANGWPLGSGDPWHDVECRTIVLSYDPNQKTAQPMGYGAENYVRPNTDIEYLVEFQNTGSDTAFYVEIRDELDANLDPASLRILGHSHPMDLELSGANELKFLFKNIILTDTATNWEQSKGYVKFVLRQKPNLADYTLLRNRAGIIFDINAPVWTNQTRHMVCRQCLLLIAVDEPKKGEKSLEITAQPNPFSTQTTLEIADAPAGEKLFRLFDLTGRTVFSTLFEGRKLEISGEGLAGGAYFFTIEKDGKRLASGKIFSQH